MRKDYIFKVWLSTIVAAPVILMLITAVAAAKERKGVDLGVGGFTLFVIAYGFILSLPTLLVVFMTGHALQERIGSRIILKGLLLILGLLSLLATFYVVFGKDAYNLQGNFAGLTFSVVYSFCLLLFGLVYPIASKTTMPIT